MFVVFFSKLRQLGIFVLDGREKIILYVQEVLDHQLAHSEQLQEVLIGEVAQVCDGASK